MEQRPPGAGRVVDFRPLPTLSSCDHGNSLNGRSALAPATFRMSGIKIRLNVCCWPMTDEPASSTCRLLGRSGLGEAKGTRTTPRTSKPNPKRRDDVEDFGYFWHHSFALQYDLSASRVNGLGKQHKHRCD